MALTEQEIYMQRCLELARRGAGNVAPNPMVGAVLVFEGRIIGEGWHRQYGKPHAEVNCFNAVSEEDKDLIPRSTLYVSLEPCSHFGKTPPCTDLIIRQMVSKVIIGSRDPFPKVDGTGMEKLRGAGIRVQTGVLEEACIALNRRYFTYYREHRPYIILKWAKTADGYIGADLPGQERMLISNEITNRLVHQWRSEEASILIGTNTASMDDPQLTTRLWKGRSPTRLVVDMELKLSPSLRVFRGDHPTIIFNAHRNSIEPGELISFQDKPVNEPRYYKVTTDTALVPQVLNALYQMKIQSVIVEGGARLLQSFIDEDAWDEARVITNMELTPGAGLPAPKLKDAIRESETIFMTDRIDYYKKKEKESGERMSERERERERGRGRKGEENGEEK